MATNKINFFLQKKKSNKNMFQFSYVYIFLNILILLLKNESQRIIKKKLLFLH
jgi:hypothetical protein